MSIDSLEQAKRDPSVNREDVQVLRNVAVKQRSTDCAHPKYENLKRMRVLGGKAEGSRVLVVDLVNVLVERAIV